MVERDVFESVNDGDQINSGYLNGILTGTIPIAERAAVVVVDQTSGSIASSTSETLIGNTTITANTVANGVLVIASGFSSITVNTGDVNNIIKLYIGAGATFGANTLRITRTHRFTNPATGNSINKNSWSAIFYVTGLTWSDPNYVQVTGQSSVSNINNIVQCDTIQVIQF